MQQGQLTIFCQGLLGYGTPGALHVDEFLDGIGSELEELFILFHGGGILAGRRAQTQLPTVHSIKMKGCTQHTGQVLIKPVRGVLPFDNDDFALIVNGQGASTSRELKGLAQKVAKHSRTYVFL